MSGNTFGKSFTVTTFGESHGLALGAIVDGCPPGIELTEEDLEAWYEMRRSSDMPGEYPEGYMHNDLDFEAWLDVMFRNAAEYGNSGWYTTSDYAEVFAETDDGKSLRSTTLHRRESEKSS